MSMKIDMLAKTQVKTPFNLAFAITKLYLINVDKLLLISVTSRDGKYEVHRTPHKTDILYFPESILTFKIPFIFRRKSVEISVQKISSSTAIT